MAKRAWGGGEKQIAAIRCTGACISGDPSDNAGGGPTGERLARAALAAAQGVKRIELLGSAETLSQPCCRGVIGAWRGLAPVECVEAPGRNERAAGCAQMRRPSRFRDEAQREVEREVVPLEDDICVVVDVERFGLYITNLVEELVHVCCGLRVAGIDVRFSWKGEERLKKRLKEPMKSFPPTDYRFRRRCG
ncbi:hypothetical protein C8R44DRAFT_728206 [Mycena epipterygia]|nr:hypothetical protein C8R44DRAFT_728206 [Mycena epipterygia]